MPNIDQKRFYAYLENGNMRIRDIKPDGFQDMEIKREFMVPRAEYAKRLFEQYVESLKFGGAGVFGK